MTERKRFLVTGATGFLGRHLLEHLNQEYPYFQAIPAVRDPATWDCQPWVKGLNCKEVITGSFSEISGKPDSLGRLDGIFHLAALVNHSRAHSEAAYSTNIEGTLDMVRLAAAKKCRMVYISTSGTVGVFNSSNEWADEH